MMKEDNELELTLTGATLTTTSSSQPQQEPLMGNTTTAVTLPQGDPLLSQQQQHHGHSHGHSHGHASASHGHGQGGLMAPHMVSTPQEVRDKVVEGTAKEQFNVLSTLIRLGTFEAFESIAQALEDSDKLKEAMHQLGDDGHSLVHWAAKRVDNVNFLSFLCQRIRVEYINIASNDNAAKMRPLHWACTEGSIPHVATLLHHGGQLELFDNSGCTPLLIAAQYGHADLVAFLHVKFKANLQATDSSMDTALHWAAYKGSMPVCGLLLHQGLQDTILEPDAFGQTPLHLASLRGNTSVVRYLLDECSLAEKRTLLLLKDKKGKTPYDLAISKNRPTVAAVLQQAMDLYLIQGSHILHYIKTTCRQLWSLHSWKTWLGCHDGHDEVDEAPKLPFYITVIHMALGGIWFPVVFTPIFNIDKGLLWDCTGLHLWTLANMCLMWFTFCKTYKSNPGLLNDDHPTTRQLKLLYEETIESFAKKEFHKQHEDDTQLCHSCHVARPLRSKHCRVARRCVLMFDHFCPFVGNTIGLYNYKWFFLYLVTTCFTYVGFFTTWIKYLMRLSSFSWVVFFCGLYMAIFFIMDLAMLVYHTQLTLTNLTTNEHQNMARYKYLHGENGRYRNPFHKGFLWNCLERFFPNEGAYTLQREGQMADLLKSNSLVDDGATVDGDIV